LASNDRQPEKGLELAHSWAATYPRFENAFNSVGLAANSLGPYERAVDALREASRLDPNAGAARVNLANALLALNPFDEC
jgi:tetratricopeptide (TPR) repeat protein